MSRSPTAAFSWGVSSSPDLLFRWAGFGVVRSGFVFLGVAIVPVANIVVASKIIEDASVQRDGAAFFAKSDLCRRALADAQGIRVLLNVSGSPAGSGGSGQRRLHCLADPGLSCTSTANAHRGSEAPCILFHQLGVEFGKRGTQCGSIGQAVQPVD
jgi:hypothetical protein